MYAVILSLYLLIAAIYLLACVFIIYHIAKYSLNQSIKVFTLLIFTVIALMFFMINLVLFFSVDWNSVLSNIF